MTTDEEIKVVIQSLQDQIKYGEEVNNEVSDYSLNLYIFIKFPFNLSFDMISKINLSNKKLFQMIMTI